MDAYAFLIAAKAFVKDMLIVTCLLSTTLVTRKEVYEKINKNFQKEYGMKRRTLIWLESDIISLDRVLARYRVAIGISIIAVSLLLLLALS